MLLVGPHIDVARVPPLLHGPIDELAGLVLEGPQDLEVAPVLDALDDDGAGGGLGNAPEVVGGVVEVLAGGPVLLVDLRRQDRHVTGAAVNLHAGAADGPGHLGVGAEDGGLDGGQEVVQVDAQLLGGASQLRHVDVHGSSVSSLLGNDPCGRGRAGGLVSWMASYRRTSTRAPVRSA